MTAAAPRAAARAVPARTPASLGARLLQRAAAQPDAPAYHFLGDDLAPVDTLSRGALLAQATACAVRIAAQTRPGDRVLLAYPPGLDFVRAFWGCLLAGRVAVPVPAPDPLRFKHAAPRLQAIVADAQAVLAVAPAPLCAAAAAEAPAVPAAAGLRWLALDGPLDDAPSLPATDGAALAYLQYTSGSTGAPRGVMLGHAQVLAQCEGLVQALRFDGDSRTLGWLPHYHDYGLVGGVLLPALTGAAAYLMSPVSFLRRPLRWLEAIGRHRITHTGAPNFGYAACLRALAEDHWDGADLSPLVSASCGAEPIRAEVMRAFTEQFARHGLRPDAFTPAYGLAEAVLDVTVKPAGRPARTLAFDAGQLAQGRVRVAAAGAGPARELVGCGAPLAPLELRIVDPASGRPCAADAVGEIWLRGASVGQGYWGSPQRSAGVFDAHLANGDGPYLRTGDLGFCHDGELFVAGRLKDLVIVGGANHYPQDIEWTAERAHPGLRAGYGAAFSIDADDGERLVVVQEVERRFDPAALAPAAEAIRAAVLREHELPVHAVVLVRAGSLPRTSSGKIRRRSCRDDYQAARLAALHAPAGAPTAAGALPRSAQEQALWDIWSEVLHRRDFGIHDSFFALGGDSLRATQVAARLRQRLQVELPLPSLFEAPTLAALAQAVERAQAPGAPPLPPIVRVPRGAPLPLSFSQRRMWLVQRFEPDTTAYNMPFALRLRGALDRRALDAALALLVERHEAFRSTFVDGDGEPLQAIAPAGAAPVEDIDLGGLAPPARPAAAAAALHRLATQRFDLAAAPPHRISLLRLADDDHVLLWLIHHAIGDLWSGMVLLREFAAAYNALRRGAAPALPPFELEFADYAHWQRRVFDEALLAGQLAFWRDRLAGLAPLALPFDRPVPAAPSTRGAVEWAPFDALRRERLDAFAADEGVTPFMVLLACFQLLLARYSGETDIAVGTPIANRTRVEAEHLVGSLVNTLVMRSDLGGDPSFRTLLGRVQQTALAAYAHQDLPFEKLVEELSGGRRAARSPLVQVLFNVLNTPLAMPPLDGLTCERFEFDHGSAQFALSLSIDTALFGQVQLNYATDLFSAAAARRLLANYLGLLDQVLDDPQRPISRHALAAAEERAQVTAWNATAMVHARELRADRMFAQRAAATPDAVALVTEAGEVSYGALAARAWAIAQALRARGVGRGALVGLCLERSPDLLAAQLGVLAAGAAYVPLDPAYPPERLRLMAEDARLALLVSYSSLVPVLAWPQTLLLDAQAAEIAAWPGTAPAADAARDARPDDPAYVIYTSGSTGRPKGVAVPHRAVTNFLASMAREPGLTSSDRLLAVTTLSFDIAVLELLLPLAVGARIVLASREQALDGRALQRLIERHDVNVMQATPATWRMLIEAGWTGASRFKALVGGEALPADLAGQLCARTGELWNMYGPTETTVWSSCWRVAQPERGIRIGRPIGNTQIHVLDAQLQPCPIGVPGELWIGGDGVALGYLHRPELTAERFVPDPFRAVPGARLYRSGDRGRWCHDGQLEHLGRLDFQVKLRGHRVELGEVEANLASHPEVARVVVLAREDVPGDVRLVAYVVPRGAMPDAQALRAHLRRHLPDYMLPQHYVALAAIPLLPNGKIDRGALPSPVAACAAAGDGHGFIAPASAAERTIARIWAELLGVPRVGTGDNFFELGGHSLLAMRAIARIERATGHRLPPQLFVFGTLAQVAQAAAPRPPAAGLAARLAGALRRPR